MASTGSATMATLLARAVRPRAVSRRARAHHMIYSERAFVCATFRIPTWSTTSASSVQSPSFSAAFSTKVKPPSLVITDAFNADSDEDDAANDSDDAVDVDADGELGFGVDLDDEQLANRDHFAGGVDREMDAAEPSSLSQHDKLAYASRFREVMDQKKEWMGELAARGETDTLLKAVFECYAPLYETHPLLQGEPCPLVESYHDPAAAAAATTRFRSKWYDNQVARITEQEAMALLVNSNRPDLAMAVFRHREGLADKVKTVTLSRGDNVLKDDVTVDLTRHFRSYYSWAMGASAMLDDHAQVFAIYENALEMGVFPTANMTLTYLNSLIAKREFEAVEALFEQIQHDDRPLNVFFYRQMLFFARATSNSKVMLQILDEMKVKGFKLRSEDYMNAVRSLDYEYFRRTPTADESSSPKFVNESYRECVARVVEQEASPAKYAQLEAACGKVIKLFHEMTEDELIVPKNPQFFPRVIASALFLHDYDRVSEYVALHEHLFGKPLGDLTSVKMAVNALLLKDEPEAAWEMVLAAHEAKNSPSTRSKASKNVKMTAPIIKAIGNVVEYLADQGDAARAVQLLEAMGTNKPSLSRFHARILLKTLVKDTEAVSNQELWSIVSQKFKRTFPVGANANQLSLFVNQCSASSRWWVISRALQARDRKEIPFISPRLALYISDLAPKDPTDADRLDLAPHLVKLVDMNALSASDRLVICCNAIRALHLLRDSTSGSDHHQREIARIQDQFLRVKGQSVPADVREILLQYI